MNVIHQTLAKHSGRYNLLSIIERYVHFTIDKGVGIDKRVGAIAKAFQDIFPCRLIVKVLQRFIHG